MRCCHADFALVEGSDRGFTLGMPTFTFGPGVLGEAGEQARELGLTRVALFTDRGLAGGPHVAKVKAALAAAGVAATVYDEVEIEPTDRSFQHAARFAADGRFDGFVSVGGGSVIDTCKAANLYATHPAEFMSYVNAPIGDARRVPGPLHPHIACPTTAGTGSETTGIAIFTLSSLDAKTGIISRRIMPTIALVDPDVTATLPSNVVAATGFDCMSHALEAMTARAWPKRLNPAKGVARPVSQGANPFSDMLASRALRLVGQFHTRAVRDATDMEARTEMMYAAMLAGIAFNASGCHLPHGLSTLCRALRATGTSTAIRRASRWCHTAWPWSCRTRLCGASRRRPIPRGTSNARSAWAPMPRTSRALATRTRANWSPAG
jgi:alcohol dehydrogenase class IV